MGKVHRINILFIALLACLMIAWTSHTVPYKLVIFEGSDWCPNCRRLEKTVLGDTSFQSFLHKNDIALERIDFPQRTPQNDTRKAYNTQMAKTYGFDGGYPSLFIATEQDSIIKKIEYTNQSSQELISKIQAALATVQ